MHCQGSSSQMKSITQPPTLLAGWEANLGTYSSKFFIMSTEFDKNISDRSHDGTDHKNGNDFFMSLLKWPKIAAKKSQIF